MASGEQPAELPIELARPLWRFIKRRRMAALLRTLAEGLLLAMLWLLSWGVVDRFMAIPPSIRLILLAAMLVLLARVLRTPVAAIFKRRLDWRAAARQLEQREPQFAQSLSTVVSEVLALPGCQGSSELTSHLSAQVAGRLKEQDLSNAAPLWPAAHAWGVTAVAALVFCGVAMWPWLAFPDLLIRQLSPLSGTDPVTSSRVAVQPGTVEVLQGDEVTIVARVHEPGREGVILRTSTDGRNWNSTGMALNPDGTYSRTLAALSRDASYEVRTGDAVKGPYAIRVLHHPVVRELRIRLEYPPYVDREPLPIVYSQGPIEAPTGTRAQVSVVASEPLRSAWFVVNGTRMEAEPAGDASVRQLSINITHDTHIELEMISRAGVSGSGPTDLSIRAIPDREPVARLLVAPGYSMLGPRGSLQLPYEAFDDYAIATLEVRIDVDGNLVSRKPIALIGNPHGQEGMIDLDLTGWNVQVGQIAAVTLAATDRASQTTTSAPWRLLVSRETVLPEQRRRIAELKDAAQIANVVIMELASARRGLDVAAASAPSTQARQGISRLALASERAALLLRSLIRAATGTNAEHQALFYVQLIDAAQIQALRIEEANTGYAADSPEAIRAQMGQLHDAAMAIERSIAQFWQGESAVVILAERRTLAAMQDQALPELDRLREAIETETQQLGLEPRLLDVDVQLQARVEAAQQMIRAYSVNDLAGATEQWARAVEPRALLVPARLAIAAEAEAVRADADPLRARDLQLAARAARALETLDDPSRAVDRASAREAFAAALGALLREHDVRRTGAPAESSPEFKARADAARQVFRAWAGDSNRALTPPGAGSPPSAGSSASEGQPALPRVSETREKALAFIRRMQDMLAEMPQLIGEVEQAAQIIRSSRNRLREAARVANEAPAAERSAAGRAVAAQQETVDGNIEILDDRAQLIDFTKPASLARQLRAYMPDTESAVSVVENEFSQALTALNTGVNERDPDGIENAVAQTRNAIALVQQGLRESRRMLLERDPTVVARSFAAATRPATQTAETFNELRRSWEDTIRRLSAAQVAAPSSDRSIFDPGQIATSRPLNGGSPNETSIFPPRTLPRPWRIEDRTVPSRDNDPPQYRDALNIYFQVLGASEPQTGP